MSTETLWLSPKIKEKIGFKVAYPALKNSGRPDNDFGPQHSLNPIFSVIFGDNQKVSVLIGKLMMRGFQNTPDFNPSINAKGMIATQT